MKGSINKLIDLFRKNAGSKSSIEDFHDWLIDNDQAEVKEETLRQLWEEPNSISKEDSLVAYSSFKEKYLPKQSNNKRLIVWRYAAAIVALICISTAYIFTQKPDVDVVFVENYSSVGKVNTIELPDGSIVTTNSTSILVYPQDFGKTNRTIYLTGEANFKVKKNEKVPFIVKSKDFAVTALGTEFNVASYPNDNFYKTTLIQGSIKIENPEADVERILAVNEQFSYNRETSQYSVLETNVEDVTAWQRGELVFREATIADIVKVLERRYEVVFHNNSKNKDVYNFRFQDDAPLEKVLEVVKNVAENFNYKLVNDICYIY